MITHNPYNLPDKILKQNQMVKPITLQNKKSRDKSYEYSKEISNKGIKIQSQMKKSVTIQHVTSSPNLHNLTPSTPSNRPLEYQSANRSSEYHQTQNALNQSQIQKRVKFLFQKFYSMNDQILKHQNSINKLCSQRQRNDRSVWQSPLLYQINSPQKQSKQKQQQNRSVHMNPMNSKGNINFQNQTNTNIQVLKTEIQMIKQNLLQIKNHSPLKQLKQQGISITKNIKLNNSTNLNQYEIISTQRQKNNELNKNMQINLSKYHQQICKLTQIVQQIKIFTQQKINKIQNNYNKIQNNFNKFQVQFHKFQANNLKSQSIQQTLIHKNNKSQQKIQYLESNIQKHMNLVNQQINNSLSKIASTINQKIAKALDNNLAIVNEKIKKANQNCKLFVQQNTIEFKQLKASVDAMRISSTSDSSSQGRQFLLENSTRKSKQSPQKLKDFSGKKVIHTFFKVSSFKSNLPASKFIIQSNIKKIGENTYEHYNSYQQMTFSTNKVKESNKFSQKNKQILFNNQIYYIDAEGYLLDQNQFYLLDQSDMIVQLDQKLLEKLKDNNLLRQI